MQTLKLNVWTKKDGKTTIVLNNRKETEKYARSLGWKKDQAKNKEEAAKRAAANVDG